MAVWKVIGGAAKGGIIVREGQELKSPQAPDCLATNSFVKELELAGDRLHYELLSGSGPQSGWVTIRVGDRDLLIPQGQSNRERNYWVTHARVALRDAPSLQGKIQAQLRKGDRVSGMPFKVAGVPWLLVSPKSVRLVQKQQQVKIPEGENTWVLIDASNTEAGLGQLLRPDQERPGKADSSVVNFRISGLSGELCAVTVDCGCPLQDLKAAIEGVTGIPSREQRLLSGSLQLTEISALQRFQGSAEDVELTLVRRPEEQAVWIEKIEKDFRCLTQAPAQMRGDREVVLAAVRQKGDMLKHASFDLKADRDIVRIAIAQDGHNIQHAAESIQGDLDMILSAVRRTGCALKHVPADQKENPEVVLEAVRQDWKALQYAALDCQARPEVVLEAMRQDGAALDVVPEEAWTNNVVMLEAVRLSGRTVTCFHGHALRRLTTCYADVDCNECNQVIKMGTCLSCRRCDYDVCDRCAEEIGNALLAGAASAEAGKEAD